jgi:hypothetical protein
VSDDHEDDGVGYARPPKQHQFQKGLSGNPKGRPRKAPAPDALDVGAVLGRRVAVRSGGKQTTMAAREVTARKQAKKGLDGDRRAILYLLDQFEKLGRFAGASTRPSGGGVVTLATSRMPFAMARLMAQRFGVKAQYPEAELAAGRAEYIAQRDEWEAKIDDEIGYADLK